MIVLFHGVCIFVEGFVDDLATIISATTEATSRGEQVGNIPNSRTELRGLVLEMIKFHVEILR